MTWEEILAAMKAAPALETEVIKYIITTEGGKEVLENHAKQYAAKEVSDKMSELLNGIDTTIAENLGITKPKDQKTTDFVKGIAEELKTLKAKKGSDNPEGDAKRVKELEAELAQAKTWENKYNGLATETAVKIEGYVNEINTLKTGNTETVVGGDLALGLNTIKFNPLIPKAAIDSLAGTIKDKVLKAAKIVDGKPVYYKEDGTPYLNEVFKPATAEEIFKTELKDMISTEAQAGGGSEEKGKIITTKEGDKDLKKAVLDPAKFNTKLTFAKHIEEVFISNGIERGSKDWHEMEQTARTEYEVDKMDRI